jgi:hypothetical protein
VVADEVKQLAMTTATSTGEIVATIATLERDAAAMTAAISAMSEGLTGVDEATSVLKQVAQEQHALVGRLDDKVGDTIEKINGMATLADRLERRAHPRVPLDQPVRLRGPVGVFEGQFGDLSEGGMLRTCQRAPGMAPGTLVDVEFELGRRAVQPARPGHDGGPHGLGRAGPPAVHQRVGGVDEGRPVDHRGSGGNPGRDLAFRHGRAAAALVVIADVLLQPMCGPGSGAATRQSLARVSNERY